MKVVKHILKISNDVCFAFTSNTNEENASATINSENKLLKIESKNNTMKTRMLFALILLYTVLVNAQTALDFNPSEGIQEVDIPTITCPSEFTIETWINLRATGSYPTILEFGGGRLFLGLEFTSDKLTLFDAFVSNTSIPLNTWTHVAVSYSTVNSEAKLYINGVLDITATNVTVDTNGVGASIGYNNGDDVFNGAIDEVRIWNRVLSEDEIDANKTSCLTGNETGLHAYYNFNEGSGTTANDLSPNNFNGTLVNMDPATDWVSFTSCDPSTHFVTTWNTGNTFNPVKSVITVPTTGGGYNYDVDWDNDGVFDQFGITGDVSFDYGVEGIYTIRIQGSFPRMYCEGNPDQGTKLISIDQWGAIKWQSFEGAFKDTSELSILALDVPDLSQVTSMARAFMNALAQFSPTFLNANSWNMSTITDMSSMFEDSLFNSPISNWDVSNVTNMNRMFNDDSSFNQDISAWNVSSVMDMANMFFDATNFNQDIGSWDVSSVTTMRDMFRNANAFDQNLENWDIGSLNANGAINMFDGVTLSTANYDALLIGWSTDSSGVSGDGIDDVTSNLTFDGGNSQYCVGEFERNQLDTNFNWNISDGGRFCPDPSTHFVTTWDTGSTFSPIKSVITILTTGGGYNYDVDWDNDGVFDQFGITGEVSFDYGVEGIYTIRIQGSFPRLYCEGNADQGTKLESVDQWGAIKWQSFEGAFKDTSELAILAPDVPDLSQVTSMARAFQNALAQFDPTFLNANSWDMSTITDMSSMFEDSGFNSPINNWDVSNVTDMDRMFLDAEQFNQNIGAWNVSAVMDMNEMFRETIDFNQNIGGWDVSNVTTMRGMFEDADAFDQNLENWDIGSLNSNGAFRMFRDITLSTVNYDALLIGWSTDSSGIPGDGIDDVPSNLTFGGGNSQYCFGETARNLLTDTAGLNWSIADGGLNCGVTLRPKVFLQGASINPILGEENLLRDDLRSNGFIPTTSPYSDAKTVESSVFTATGSDALVDWVWVELRSPINNRFIIDSQSALLQRDGDIVDVDGSSALRFFQDTGNYHIAIKHRNHLGIMSASSIALNTTDVLVDFTDGSTVAFGSNAQTNFGMPTGILGMWAGNVNGDSIVQYSGTNPDTPSILSTVLNDPGNFLNFPTFSITAYNANDVNMNSVIQYSGTSPDTPFIIQNVLAHPGNFLNFSTYQIIEQLPENL